MADVGQVLATGGTTIVGVAVGAGLTYWFDAKNRRHQEAREDATRWYEARLRAYSEVSSAVFSASMPTTRREDYARLADSLNRAFAEARLVGSRQVVRALQPLSVAVVKQLAAGDDSQDDLVYEALDTFEEAARQDLGHPVPET